MSHFKPKALKILEGNPGKRPLNYNEPQPVPGAPTCPRWLLPEARKEWKRVVPELERLGLLTRIDRAALAIYCQAYAHLLQCEEALQDSLTHEYTNNKGKTNRTAKVEARLASEYMKLIKSFCAEFGLTPSSRGRMQVPGMDAEAEDEFDEFLNTGKMS